VGDNRRTVFDMHPKRSVWITGLVNSSWISKRRALACFAHWSQKEGSSPTYVFHVIACGSSDKEINKVQHSNAVPFELISPLIRID
jgi:hypothetical protein